MVKSMKIVLDRPDYAPGSTVQGQVVVNVVDRPYKCHSIVVELWGGAMVHWEDDSESDCDNLETYFCTHETVWKLESSSTGDLPVGEHFFSFSFQLPPDTVPSFEGSHGQVKYELKAEIVHTGLISSIVKSRHQVKAYFNVEERTHRTDILRLYGEPILVERTKRLFFSSGSICITVNLPHSGFSCGETIPVSVHVKNQSSRRICIESCLKRRDLFTCADDKVKRVGPYPITAVLSSLITPQLSTSCDRYITIPPHAQATVRKCSIISVEYTLDIRVVIPWSFDMLLKIPIVVANGEPIEGECQFPVQPHLDPGSLLKIQSIQWPQ